MGFYSEAIFPRLCDFLMNTPFLAKQRQQLLATVHGEVLEIGFGTGLTQAGRSVSISGTRPQPGARRPEVATTAQLA